MAGHGAYEGLQANQHAATSASLVLAAKAAFPASMLSRIQDQQGPRPQQSLHHPPPPPPVPRHASSCRTQEPQWRQWEQEWSRKLPGPSHTVPHDSSSIIRSTRADALQAQQEAGEAAKRFIQAQQQLEYNFTLKVQELQQEADLAKSMAIQTFRREEEESRNLLRQQLQNHHGQDINKNKSRRCITSKLPKNMIGTSGIEERC